MEVTTQEIKEALLATCDINPQNKVKLLQATNETLSDVIKEVIEDWATKTIESYNPQSDDEREFLRQLMYGEIDPTEKIQQCK